MVDWVTNLIESGGYLTIAFLMLLENVFPPIPSEIVMPAAGLAAAQGDLNIVLVVLSGSIGSLAGAYFWYWIGVKVSAERLKRWAAEHGRWLTLTPKEIDHVDAWFDEHGHKAVLIGRLVPTVRTLISVPAGLTGMSVGRFLVYSAIGTSVWTALLAGAGYWLEEGYQQASHIINPLSTAITVGLVAWYLYRVATFDPVR